MDNETNGLSDRFLARHTTDSALLFQLLSQPTRRLTEITRNIICGYCCRQKYVSRSSATNTNYGLTDSFESTDNSLPVLEQSVEEARPLGARVLREREEREEFGREIERKEREIREQRARKRREREARELEEARLWPQQQEPITGLWCACRNEGQETAQGSEQASGALSEPKQESS